MLRTGFQIDRVSAETGLSADAIRFYEKQRLLERVERTEVGFRRFNEIAHRGPDED
jgi:DNA-binding transcriptional MerR regulator